MYFDALGVQQNITKALTLLSQAAQGSGRNKEIHHKIYNSKLLNDEKIAKEIVNFIVCHSFNENDLISAIAKGNKQWIITYERALDAENFIKSFAFDKKLDELFAKPTEKTKGTFISRIINAFTGLCKIAAKDEKEVFISQISKLLINTIKTEYCLRTNENALIRALQMNGFPLEIALMVASNVVESDNKAKNSFIYNVVKPESWLTKIKGEKEAQTTTSTIATMS